MSRSVVTFHNADRETVIEGLRNLADKFESTDLFTNSMAGFTCPIRDTNGNLIGSFRHTELGSEEKEQTKRMMDDRFPSEKT